MLMLNTYFRYVLQIFFCTVGTYQPQDEPDQLCRIIDAYEQAVALLNETEPTTAQRVQFRSDWLGRLQEATRANPESSWRKTALSKMVGLANGLGKFELSEAISRELVSTSNSAEEKARWVLEQAEINFVKYTTSRNDDVLEVAIESYLECHEIAAALPSDVAKVLQVQSLTLAAERSKTHLHEIGKSFNRSLDILQSRPEVEKEITAQGFGIARLVTAAVSVFSKLQLESQVNDMLMKLSKLTPPLPQPLWITVLQSADIMFPISDKPRIDFLNKWKDVSPFLRFHLARAKLDLKDYSGCIVDLLILRDRHKIELLEQDQQALEEKSGGYYGEVLLNLALCYARVGKWTDAEEQLSASKTLVPKDPRINLLESELQGRLGEVSKLEPSPRAVVSSTSFVVFLVIGAAFFLLFFALRKGLR